MAKHELWELKQRQQLPMQAKVLMTRQRIREWVNAFGEDGVYISFSGGKDSTVLLDIVRKDYPDIEAVFVNTGLEYPSVRQFALSKENVTELRPAMKFRDVITKYGYPVIGKLFSQCVYEARAEKDSKTKRDRIAQFEGKIDNKYSKDYSRYGFILNAPFLISHKCCDVMKKKPNKKYQRIYDKKPILGTMAEESQLREVTWIKEGCNSFDSKYPTSKPMSFWTEQDVLQYIHENNLAIADAYGQVVVKNEGIAGQINIHDFLGDYRDCQYGTTGCKRTGCIFCAFGINQDKQRFVRLSEQEPELCSYVLRGGKFNENGVWQPGRGGLGYWFVLEWLNVHGNLKIGIPDREHYLSAYQTDETIKYLRAKNEAVRKLPHFSL